MRISDWSSDVCSSDLREINTAAGTTNASAIQYHFGGRRGLVKAVLAKHEVDIERRRHEMLDAYEQRREDDIRALAAALVEPIAAELATDGGPGYLQLVADLYNRPNPTFEPGAAHDHTTHLGRWTHLVRPRPRPPAAPP